MLRLTYDDFQRPALIIVSQVQYLWTTFRKKKSLIEMYDGGAPFVSPVEAWINEACQNNASPWHRFQVFHVLKKVLLPALIKMKILVQTQHIINEVLSWIALKGKDKISRMNCLLRLDGHIGGTISPSLL